MESRCVMDLEKLKSRKKELGYTNQKISEETGIPLGTIQKIYAGVTKTPRWDKVEAIEALLFGTSGSTGGYTAVKNTGGYTSCLSEPGNDYVSQAVRTESGKSGAGPDERDPSAGSDPMQGHYTIEDYLKLPDERRVELIDGFIYDMSSPSNLHQAVLGELHIQFYACAEKHPECELFFAPSDVKLGKNGKTVVQPDLYIICGRDEDKMKQMSEAPDFALEIVSASSRAHDMFRKLNKYRFSGVREYWIVDPQRQEIIVYDLEHDRKPETYDFTATINVGISNGSCSIDFQKVLQKVQKYI